MTEEEKQQAAAYIKLHEDVRQLILDTVVEELMYNIDGALAQRLLFITDKVVRDRMPSEMQNYRIVMRGNTANY